MQLKFWVVELKSPAESCAGLFLLCSESLFVSQAFDRVELCGFSGRKHAEEQTDADGNTYRQHDHPHLDLRGHRRDECHEQITDSNGEHDADQAAEECKRHRFEKELENYRAPCCSYRFSDADLFRSFSNRNQHYVHYPNAADKQAET